MLQRACLGEERGTMEFLLPLAGLARDHSCNVCRTGPPFYGPVE